MVNGQCSSNVQAPEISLGGLKLCHAKSYVQRLYNVWMFHANLQGSQAMPCNSSGQCLSNVLSIRLWECGQHVSSYTMPIPMVKVFSNVWDVYMRGVSIYAMACPMPRVCLVFEVFKYIWGCLRICPCKIWLQFVMTCLFCLVHHQYTNTYACQ